jgi:crotonobetainyl-CoA:carnitine CoA-transferase CaiB-like acyl-CoA transferase
MEMIAGWDALNGYPDAPPIMMGAMFADAITGLQMAAMALVALEYRNQAGEGQHVDGSMYEAAVGYIGEEMMRASLRPGETVRRSNRSLYMAPHGLFRCAGDDSWVAIAVRDDADWRALVDLAASSSATADPSSPLALRPSKGGRGTSSDGGLLGRREWHTVAGRLTDVDALEAAISAWTAAQDAHSLMRRLQEAGVPAGAVQTPAEVLEDEHFKARDWFIPMTHADMGTHRQNGFPWRFSRSAMVAATPSPRLGEHSREVLSRELGLSDAEIEALFAEGVSRDVLASRAKV